MIGALLWTVYLSFTNATLMPSYRFAGLMAYEKLWANPRWILAYKNLFVFSAFSSSSRSPADWGSRS